MGQRFRLRSDFDITGFSPRIRVILTALKQYGMMLADNGSAWFISGVPDERWDNDELQALKTITGAQFEAVDVSSLMLDPDSSQIPPGCSEADPPPVSDISITTPETFRACDQITTGPGVSVFGPNGHAVFAAGSSVVVGNDVSVFPDGRLEISTGLPLPP